MYLKYTFVGYAENRGGGHGFSLKNRRNLEKIENQINQWVSSYAVLK